MENYRKILYRAAWIAMYRQLQDPIFFTRAEVYPVNFSNSFCLKLHLSWKNFDKEWYDMDFCAPFDEDFPRKLNRVLTCVNNILIQASYEDCACLASIADMYNNY